MLTVICANGATKVHTNSEGNYYDVFYISVVLAIDVHQGNVWKRLCCRYQVSSNAFLTYRGRCLTFVKTVMAVQLFNRIFHDRLLGVALVCRKCVI